jgi:hypothetical protein
VTKQQTGAVKRFEKDVQITRMVLQHVDRPNRDTVSFLTLSLPAQSGFLGPLAAAA